ncbi:hypothetical protein GBF38_001898 [Nibea albiflora]|uniref:Uncharacterized protein n=1 Tax=Nibea albiflora TaxID=240163 RepID=A0ACB7ECN2_NIBAL|nr:hypothetical protein GBF38_001898 [Nibea albiflora]
MFCGRTKAEAVVTDILSAKEIEEVIKKLKSGGSPLAFSLHADGNRKMFPLDVQFFTPENGVVNKNWVLLKSYLIRIGEECPKCLKDLLRLTEDAAGVEEKADIVKVHLLFCNNVLSLFQEVVKMLEKNVTMSVDLFFTMDSFRGKTNSEKR